MTIMNLRKLNKMISMIKNTMTKKNNKINHSKTQYLTKYLKVTKIGLIKITRHNLKKRDTLMIMKGKWITIENEA
jgi:hypothetical protein